GNTLGDNKKAGPQGPGCKRLKLLRFETTENTLGVLMEDFFFLSGIQPREAFDHRPDIVVPSAGARIFFRAGAGPFSAEEAAIGTDDLEQQFERFDAVKRRVEIQLLQTLVEILGVVGAAQLGPPPCEIISLSLGKSSKTFELKREMMAIPSSVMKWL